MNDFIKPNNSRFPDALMREAHGLEALRQLCNAELICVPDVIDVNPKQLVMTLINSRRCSPGLAARLGQGLAELHQQQQSYYGLEEDNYIGLNPQINGSFQDWGEFFISNRLRYQIGLIENVNLRDEFALIVDAHESKLACFLNQHCAYPSLVHGDLWNGNYLSDGENVWLIDPAVYYADREVDIAMTEMFGGFDAAFYKAYEWYFPLTKAYPLKKKIFNLYHYLNHYNLFGESYLAHCRQGFEVIEAL